MKNNLKDFRTDNVTNLDKSQELFEKQLSYISAGSLGISMFLIEKVVKDLSSAHYKWIIIFCWISLGLTLILNLISHFLAVKFSYKNIEELDSGSYNYSKSSFRNNVTKVLNIVTLITLIIGIVLLVIFMSINI